MNHNITRQIKIINQIESFFSLKSNLNINITANTPNNPKNMKNILKEPIPSIPVPDITTTTKKNARFSMKFLAVNGTILLSN